VGIFAFPQVSQCELVYSYSFGYLIDDHKYATQSFGTFTFVGFDLVRSENLTTFWGVSKETLSLTIFEADQRLFDLWQFFISESRTR
jgi:hypothetical protein